MHGFAMVSLNYPRYLQQGQILKVNDTVRHTSRKAVIVNKSGQARSPFTACRSLDALKRQSMRKNTGEDYFFNSCLVLCYLIVRHVVARVLHNVHFYQVAGLL